VFWLSTVIGASFAPPTLTDTAERSVMLFAVVAPRAEAGADPADVPAGTSPVRAVASPAVPIVDVVTLVSAPPASPPTALIAPACAFVRLVSESRPTLVALPVVPPGAPPARGALGVQDSGSTLAAETAPVWVPPVWASDALVPQSAAAGLGLAASVAVPDGAALESTELDGAGESVAARGAGVGEPLGEAAAGDGVAAAVGVAPFVAVPLEAGGVDAPVLALATGAFTAAGISGVHAFAGACAVVVVVSQPGATAVPRSAGSGLVVGVPAAAVALGAADPAAEALAAGSAVVALARGVPVGTFGVTCGDAELSALVVVDGADGSADGWGVLATAAAVATAAEALAMGSPVGAMAPGSAALGVARGDAEGAALVASEAVAGADGLGVGVAAAEALGVASGDAEVAALVTSAEAVAGADGLGLGEAGALVGEAGSGDGLDAAGITGSFEGLGDGLASKPVMQASCVAVSSPLPRTFACTAAATLDAERTIAMAMAVARDALPCFGSSTMFAIRRPIRLRAPPPLVSLTGSRTPDRRPVLADQPPGCQRDLGRRWL
jgi:hypothetical protein